MKDFNEEKFFYLVAKAKEDVDCYEILPSLRIVLIMAIWEGLASPKSLDRFDLLVA